MKNFKELLTQISEHTISTAKAVFVVGVPGSGKDVLIRSINSMCSITEMNHNQAYAMLCLGFVAENNNDRATASIMNKSPLIITAPATDINHITHINESLHELGYSTNLVFVNTTNDISSVRNSKLTKTLSETIRVAKWNHCQENLEKFSIMFDEIIVLDNVGTIDQFNESVEHVTNNTKIFLESTHKTNKTKQNTSKFTNSDISGKVINTDGIGPTRDDRGYQGSGAFGSVQQEQKEFKSFRKGIKEGIEAGSEGLGTIGDASAKEPMDTLRDKENRLSPPRIKKKVC